MVLQISAWYYAFMKDADRERSCLEKLTWESREQARAAIAYASWQYGPGSRPQVDSIEDVPNRSV